jgi:hypothetical protein
LHHAAIEALKAIAPIVVDMGDTRFAFGNDTVDGCECPVLHAGESTMKRAYSRIAEAFDNSVYERNPEKPFTGTLSRDEAEACMDKAIERLQSEQLQNSGVSPSTIRKAREVREEVFG